MSKFVTMSRCTEHMADDIAWKKKFEENEDKK